MKDDKKRLNPVKFTLHVFLVAVASRVLFGSHWGWDSSHVVRFLNLYRLDIGLPTVRMNYIANSLFIVPMAVICIISLYIICTALYEKAQRVQFTHFSLIICFLFFLFTVREFLFRLDDVERFGQMILFFGGVELIRLAVVWIISNLIIKNSLVYRILSVKEQYRISDKFDNEQDDNVKIVYKSIEEKIILQGFFVVIITFMALFFMVMASSAFRVCTC